MYYFMGFFGALACLVTFGAGFVSGWSAYRLTRRRKPPKRELPPEQDVQRDTQEQRDLQHDMQEQRDAQRDMQAEQDAFRRLQNYSAEDAYGRNQPDELPVT